MLKYILAFMVSGADGGQKATLKRVLVLIHFGGNIFALGCIPQALKMSSILPRWMPLLYTLQVMADMLFVAW